MIRIHKALGGVIEFVVVIGIALATIKLTNITFFSHYGTSFVSVEKMYAELFCAIMGVLVWYWWRTKG